MIELKQYLQNLLKMQKVIALICCYVVILPIAILQQETTEDKTVILKEVENEDTKADQYQRIDFLSPEQIKTILSIWKEEEDRIKKIADFERKFEEVFDAALKQVNAKVENQNEANERQRRKFFQRNFELPEEVNSIEVLNILSS